MAIVPPKDRLEMDLERYLRNYSLDPGSRVFAPLGETYRKLGKLDEAIGILEEGIKEHPNYASGYITLGRCFSDKKDSKRAIDGFKKALEFAPDNLMAYKLLARELKNVNDEKTLTETYQRLLKISPQEEEAVSYLTSKGLLKKSEPKPIITEIPKTTIPEKRESIARDFEVPIGQKKDELTDVEPAPTVIAPESEKKLQEEPESLKRDVEKRNLEFYTMTLADIYLKQGLKSQAKEIYQVLLEANPNNKIYSEALSNLSLKSELPVDKNVPPVNTKETPSSDKVAILRQLLDRINTRKRKK